ncbi:MAG: hypothetical protein ABSE56_05665 [Bryobacteraceae bacterium]|jgi:hypothetical protein
MRIRGDTNLNPVSYTIGRNGSSYRNFILNTKGAAQMLIGPGYDHDHGPEPAPEPPTLVLGMGVLLIGIGKFFRPRLRNRGTAQRSVG